MRKPWSIHWRNGIIQVQFYDYENKRYLTAKSTGTKDMNEASIIINRWWFESGLEKQAPDKIRKAFSCPDVAAAASSSLADTQLTVRVQELYEMAKKVALFNPGNSNSMLPYTAQEYEDAPEEIKPLLDQLESLTFYDYLLLYWNYDESPYIKGLTRKGEAKPNPERFRQLSGVIKKYAHHVPSCLLVDITASKVDGLISAIRGAVQLKENTIKNMRKAFTQPLRFAYKNNLIARNIAEKITPISKSSLKKAKQESEKSIFTKEEIQRLFNSTDNPFGSDTFRLVNELLFKTGCRIGELQALQMQDIIKTDKGYVLKIDKNYCRASKRLKSTKTERSDLVPISADLAAKLLAHIAKSAYKDIPAAFIFSSAKSAYIPLCYECIVDNFNKTMAAQGIKRQNLTLHSYRHTFATFLRMAGYSGEQLLYLTRHDSPSEVHRYTNHYTPEMEQLKYQAAADIERLVA